MMIETTNISKQYPRVLAVDGVNLQVEKGMVFGLLGPNGAGKTTMVRLLTGILRPSAGSARVLGFDVGREGDRIRRQCGVQTDTNLYERLSARDNLLVWGRLYDLRGAPLRNRVDELIEQFDLTERADDMLGTFSKGMKQKVALARALVHDPALLFLDEPTAGLDPESSTDLLEYLQKYVERADRTVFLCSHRLEEVERLCQSVGIIHQGRLLACGSIAQLSAQIWREVVFTITLQQPALPYAGLLLQYGIKAEAHNSALSLVVQKQEDIAGIIRKLVHSGAEILEAVEQKHGLHDIYFHYLPRGNHELAKY
ncbi:ABC transporter ATP-binding protein [candidate division KSB1 bacterium]|nr:ABC transporter ATP-binding protein [candidate division KSB1 bacterium]